MVCNCTKYQKSRIYGVWLTNYLFKLFMSYHNHVKTSESAVQIPHWKSSQIKNRYQFTLFVVAPFGFLAFVAIFAVCCSLRAGFRGIGGAAPLHSGLRPPFRSAAPPIPRNPALRSTKQQISRQTPKILAPLRQIT